MLGQKRLELIKQRMAWLGHQFWLARQPPKALGMARAKDGLPPKAKKRKNNPPLKRPPWMVLDYSNCPAGESVLAHQPHWMHKPIHKPTCRVKPKRRMGSSAVGQIAQKLPPFKLPKRPEKYQWQA